MAYDFGPIIKHNIDSSSYLERAKKLLQSFDEGSVESLFYAALELRMGIEARLFTYIDTSLRSMEQSNKQIKGYQADKLLKALAKIDPKSKDPLTMFFGLGRTGPYTTLEYTPVTRELARYHSKLGALLHHTFFRSNKYWHFGKELGEKSKEKSLKDIRNWLDKVVSEFEKANSGILLNHPNFVQFIEKLDKSSIAGS